MNLPNEAKICNCAKCGKILISKKETSKFWYKILDKDRRSKISLIEARIDDRPYCGNCLLYFKPHTGRVILGNRSKDYRNK